jgi:hypothetical protein
MLKHFPGMDPYLEDPAFWPDFQPTFVASLRELIAAALPEPYEARINSNLAGRHDPLKGIRETRIEILHRPERDLVTVVEVLSPWNKTGDGFFEYRAKRKAILQQPVHLVELDLLPGGRRLPMGRPLPDGDYYAYVSRSEDRPNGAIYSWRVRDSLPPVPIPLRGPDPDITIELQAVFQVTFERGRYGRSLRYGKPPPAKMSEADVAWAIECGTRVAATPRPV